MKLRIPKDMKLWSLIGAAVLTAWLGWLLEDIAFEPSGMPGQAFVTVFTKERTASVSLQAVIHPSSPWQDWLTVHVNGAHGMQERWLLVVQCPTVPAASAYTVGLHPEAGTQPSTTFATVTVSPHVGKSWAGYLRCFPARHQGSSSVALGFADATLPALETDPFMAAAQETPQLYVERDSSSHLIKDLVEVFPACPAASPTATTVSPAPTGTASQRPIVSARGRPPASSPPTVSTTSSPNPGNSSCYSPQVVGTTPDVYQLPASVATTEILENVNLSGYRIDSMFPPGQFGNRDQITWQGISSLSPSLLVTNVAAEHQLNKYIFISGVLFGICGGAFVTLLVESFDVWRESRRKNGSVVAKKYKK